MLKAHGRNVKWAMQELRCGGESNDELLRVMKVIEELSPTGN